MNSRLTLFPLTLLWLVTVTTLMGQTSGNANNPDRLDRIQVGGQVELEGGVGLQEGDLQKLRLDFSPTLQIELGAGLQFTAIGRLRGDSAFDHGSLRNDPFREVSDYSRPLLLGDSGELELREVYLRAEPGGARFTLGKQQIVWGVADGLKVLDIVNPQDFREFILDDFEDSRIPLWALNLEIPLGESVLQVVWLPDPSHHILPRADSQFAFTAVFPQAPEGVELQTQFTDPPSHFFADSDAGIRLATFQRGWDLTFLYFYHYSDTPVFRSHPQLGTVFPKVVAKAEYERGHLLGGSFSNAFGDLTLRGEYGIFLNRFHLTNDVFQNQGVAETDEVSYVVGLDWFGFNDTFLSVQLFQNWLMRKPAGLLRDRVENAVTFFVEHRLLRDAWKVSGIWLTSANDGDGLVRPKVSYDWNDSLTFWGGADIFYGAKDGLFGQFGEEDRAVLGIEWSF